MDGAFWLELAGALVAGLVLGWFARLAWARRARPDGAAGSAAPAHEEPASDPVPLARPVSPEADTARRVILHLAALGRLGNDEVGRLGFTQRGMSDALSVRQGTLTKVLSRLAAAEVVEVDRRHVEGQPRRLNVYRLTALGESVARDLRHPRPDTTSADARGPGSGRAA